MKKILHITMSNAYGGAETVIFSIIENLRDKYEFVYLCPKGDIESLLKEKSIKYKTFSSVKDIITIKQLIKEINPEVIHAHDFMASVLCRLTSRKNINIISHLHTSHRWIKTNNLKSLVYYVSSFRFKHIIVVSNSMKDDMYYYKKMMSKTKVIINPVDIKKVLYLSNEYEESKKYDLGFFGRLSDYKDPLNFISTVNDIKSKNENVKAVIIGAGELEGQCREKISQLNLSDTIDMKGFKKNPFPIVKNIKILIMPSKVEALGLAAIEGMTLGRVVVASNVGGFRDFIDEDNGVLCNSYEEFIFNIDKLLKNDKIYDKLAINAIKTAKRLGNVEKYMEEICNIYDSKEEREDE